MRRIERQTTISAPVAKGFSYLADFPRHGEWAANRLHIEQASAGPVGVCSTFTSVGHQFGHDNEDHLTVTEFVPNEKIVFESEGGAGRIRHYFLLQEEDGETRLTKGAELLKPSFLLRILFSIATVLRVTARRYDGALRRIKAKLEESSG